MDIEAKANSKPTPNPSQREGRLIRLSIQTDFTFVLTCLPEKICSMMPSSLMIKVVRMVPIVFLPYITFSPQAPIASINVLSTSAINGKGRTIDYCVTGGGFRDVLKNSRIKERGDQLYRDVFVEYLEKNLGGHVSNDYAEPQGRIKIIQ